MRKNNIKMRFYPQFLLWTCVLLPAISLLLSPTFIMTLARAQRQRARLMTNALAARGRAAAALARSQQRKYMPNNRFSSDFSPIRPFKLRAKRELEMVVPGIEVEGRRQTFQRNSHWDQQEEALGQLENMWNMNNFGSTPNERVVRSMHDHVPVENVGAPFIYSNINHNNNDEKSNYYSGVSTGRNVFDYILEQNAPPSFEQNKNGRLEDRAAEPEPTLKKLKKKSGKKQEPYQQNYYNYYYPSQHSSYGSSYYSPYGRSNEFEALPTEPVELESKAEAILGDPSNFDERLGNPEPTFEKLKKKLGKKQEPHQQNYYNYYYPPQYSSYGSYYSSPYGRSNEFEALPQEPVEIEDKAEAIVGEPSNVDEILGNPEPTFKKLKKKLGKKQEPHQQNYYNYYYPPQYSSYGSSYSSPYGRSNEFEALPQEAAEAIVGDPSNIDERVGNPEPTFEKLKKKKLGEEHQPYPYPQRYYNNYYPQNSPTSSYYYRSAEIENVPDNGPLISDIMGKDNLEEHLQDTDPNLGDAEPSFKKKKFGKKTQTGYPSNYYNSYSSYNPYSREAEIGRMAQNMQEHEIDDFMMGEMVAPRFADPEPFKKKEKSQIEHMPPSFYYPQTQYGSYYSPSGYSNSYQNPYVRSHLSDSENKQVGENQDQNNGNGNPIEANQRLASPEPHNNHRKIEQKGEDENKFFFSSNFYERDSKEPIESMDNKSSNQETNASLNAEKNKEQVRNRTDDKNVNSLQTSENIPTPDNNHNGEDGSEDVGCELTDKIEGKLEKKLKKLLKLKDKKKDESEYPNPPMYPPTSQYGGEYEQSGYYRSASEADKGNKDKKSKVENHKITEKPIVGPANSHISNENPEEKVNERKEQNVDKLIPEPVHQFDTNMRPVKTVNLTPVENMSKQIVTENVHVKPIENIDVKLVENMRPIEDMNEPMTPENVHVRPVQYVDENFNLRPVENMETTMEQSGDWLISNVGPIDFTDHVQRPNKEIFNLNQQPGTQTIAVSNQNVVNPINIAPQTITDPRSSQNMDFQDTHREDVGCELDDNLFESKNARSAFDPYAFYQKAVEGISEESKNIAKEAENLLHPEKQSLPVVDKPQEPHISYVDIDEISQNGYPSHSPDRLHHFEEKSANRNADPHLHSHGGSTTHSHFHSHTHGHTHQKDIGNVHGGHNIHPINSHHQTHGLPQHQGFSQANAQAQAFAHGGHQSSIAHANSKSFGHGFGPNGAIAESGAQAFNGGPQINNFGGFGQSAASAGSVIQNGGQFNGFGSNGGFGQSGSLIQNGQHFVPNAAQAEAQAISNGAFGLSNAQAAAQAGNFANGFQVPQGVHFNNNPIQFTRSSADVRNAGRQRHEQESFIMPHLDELPVRDMFSDMQSGAPRLSRAPQDFSTALGGLGLASSIVDASLNRDRFVDDHKEKRLGATQDARDPMMDYVTNIVDSSLGAAEQENTFKTHNPTHSDLGSAKDLTFQGISSITDLVNKGLRIRRQIRSEEQSSFSGRDYSISGDKTNPTESHDGESPTGNLKTNINEDIVLKNQISDDVQEPKDKTSSANDNDSLEHFSDDQSGQEKVVLSTIGPDTLRTVIYVTPITDSSAIINDSNNLEFNSTSKNQREDSFETVSLNATGKDLVKNKSQVDSISNDKDADLLAAKELLPHMLFDTETRKNISDLTSDEIQELQFDLPNNPSEGNNSTHPENINSITEETLLGSPLITDDNFNAETVGDHQIVPEIASNNTQRSEGNHTHPLQGDPSHISNITPIPTPDHSHKDSIRRIILNISEGPFASIEAEMGILTDEEKEAFIKQEVDLIAEVIEETFKSDKWGENNLPKHPEMSNINTTDNKDTTEKVVSSPNLFQDFQRRSNREEYSRQAEEKHLDGHDKQFNDLLDQHKEKVEKIKNIAADDDNDLLMISFIGDSVIKDLENRRNTDKQSNTTDPFNATSSFDEEEIADKINALNTTSTFDEINLFNDTTSTNPTNRSKKEIRGVRSSRAPLTQLISDPTTKLDVEKTLQNIGNIARHTFENPRAPMYHVRNMLGNAKNSVMSAVKVPPNNFFIPSKYKIDKISRDKDLDDEKVGAVNQKMLLSRSGFGDTQPEGNELEESGNGNSFGLDHTVQKIGGMLRDSVQNGKDAVAHVNEIAEDAKKVLHASKHATPRLIYPYPKPKLAVRASNTPILGSARTDIPPIKKKAMLITPKIFDFQKNIVGAAQENPESFVGMGHILDAVGLTQPNLPEAELQRIEFEPLSNTNFKPFAMPKKSIPKSTRKLLINDNLQKETKDQNSVLGASQDGGQTAVTENLKHFMQRMHNEMREMVMSQYEERKRQRKQRTQEQRTKQYKRNKKDFKKVPRQSVMPLERSFRNLTPNIVEENVGMSLFPHVIDTFSQTPQKSFNQDFMKKNENFPKLSSRIQENPIGPLNPDGPLPIAKYAEEYPYQGTNAPINSQLTNDEKERVGFYLPDNLMKPFMGQPTETLIHDFMRQNGDEDVFERESSDDSKKKSVALRNPITKVKSLLPSGNVNELIEPSTSFKMKPLSPVNRDTSLLNPDLVGSSMPKTAVDKDSATDSAMAEKAKEFVELLSDPEIDDEAELPGQKQKSSMESNVDKKLMVESSSVATINTTQEDDKVNNTQKLEKPVRRVFKNKPLTVEHVPDQNDLGYVLGAVNPIMFERYFNERLKINDTSSKDTHESFLEKGIVQQESDDGSVKAREGSLGAKKGKSSQSSAKGDEKYESPANETKIQLDDNSKQNGHSNQQGEDVVSSISNLPQGNLDQVLEGDANEIKNQGRTSMKVIDPYKKPFMGFIEKDKMNQFLNQYNNHISEDNAERDEYKQDGHYKQQDNIEPAKNVIFSSLDDENDYYNNYGY